MIIHLKNNKEELMVVILQLVLKVLIFFYFVFFLNVILSNFLKFQVSKARQLVLKNSKLLKHNMILHLKLWKLKFTVLQMELGFIEEKNII